MSLAASAASAWTTPSGINPKVVSERLGHATVSFTLDTYSHVMPGLQEDAAARVAALLKRPTQDDDTATDSA